MTDVVTPPPKSYRAPLACFVTGAVAFSVFTPVAIVTAILFVGFSDGIDLALYTGEKLLRAAGANITPDSPGTGAAVVVVTSSAIAGLGAFLVIASMVWTTVRYGPHQRVSRVWKARSRARTGSAAAYPFEAGPKVAKTQLPAPATVTLTASPVPADAVVATAARSDLTGGDPLSATPPEVWKG